jgi:hypothetical protein
MLRTVKLTATFYNSDITVIGTDFAYTTIDVLLPNQKSPFEIIEVDEGILPQIAYYNVAVTNYDITTEPPYREFSILSHSSHTDILGYYHVVGEVQNTGGQAATFVKVVGTFYDVSGKVVAAELIYTSPSDLTPGQIAPFEMIVVDTAQSAKISSYLLQVQS